MLDSAPVADQHAGTAPATDDEIFCAACRRSMTRERWRVSRRDAHEHTVFNPAGQVFTIFCFTEAPGALLYGSASSDFTWFPGYRWTVALCGSCRVHVGWHFDGGDVFFALIKSRITEKRP